MIEGVGLRKFEGTREMALAIEMGDEGTGEIAVGASRREDDPARSVSLLCPLLNQSTIDAHYSPYTPVTLCLYPLESYYIENQYYLWLIQLDGSLVLPDLHLSQVQ